MPTRSASPPSRMSSSLGGGADAADREHRDVDDACVTAVNSSRFHTGVNGARRPPSHVAGHRARSRSGRDRARPARKRARMAALSPQIDDGDAAPAERRVGEDRDLDGRHRVEAPLLRTRRHSLQRLVPGDVAGERRRLLATGTLTVHVKSAPARSAIARRMTSQHARPAFGRAAELVVAPVVERREELVEQLGVGRRQLDPVVAGLACPRRHVAVAGGHRVHLVGGHHVDRDAGGTPVAGRRGTGDAASSGPRRRCDAYGSCHASIA